MASGNAPDGAPPPSDGGTDNGHPRSRTAARAAFAGFAVDYFDIYLPIVALAPAIGYFQPPGLSSVAQTTLFYVTFAVTLIGRPIGSILFGGISDRIGRRRATLVAVVGFTAATFLTAALPGHAASGLWGIGGLLVLRLVGGVFMGGEYTSANPLALEAAGKAERGRVGAFIASAYPTGYVLISLVTIPLLTLLPSAGPDSLYQVWGWRIPFVVGGLLGVAFFLYFRGSVEESEVWREQRAATAGTEQEAPVRLLLKDPATRKRLGQTLLVMSGLWFGVQGIVSPATGMLITELGQNAGAVTWALLLANVVLFFGYLVVGALGQRFGRRRVLVASGIGTLTVSAAAYAVMVSILEQGGSFGLAMVLYTVCLLVAVSPLGIATVYLLECFPTAVRASGYGFAYSVSLVVPSFYRVYLLGLADVLPYAWTPVVLIVVSGALTAVGAAIGPETNDVDFAVHEPADREPADHEPTVPCPDRTEPPPHVETGSKPQHA